MISLTNITLTFGPTILLDDISCTFKNNQRVGIVGRNGAGKSTLLKVIAGLIEPDSGTIGIDKATTIAYMPQELTLTSEKTIFDETFSAFSAFFTALQEEKALEAQLKEPGLDHTILVERYEKIQTFLRQFDRAAAEKHTIAVLVGLGFKEQNLHAPVASLSVGWKMRIVLAKLLLQRADFYLFDEPTNHLDIVAQEWFFNFLKNSSCGFLLVSHDRFYLDNACSSIFEIERGKAKLYNGNYSAYLTQKEHDIAITKATYERQVRDLARKQAVVDKFRASACRAKQAQSMQKQIDAVELVEPEPPLPTISFKFPPAERSGIIVLSVKNVAHSFGEKHIFSNVSFDIQRGEKVALVAANGVGKTTLFNLIVGKEELKKGTVNFGYSVHSAFFEQDQLAVLQPNNSVYDEVLKHCPTVPEQTVRSFLGSFLFSGDDIFKKISVLSGGERNRVALVKLLLQRANCLLMDEPTNHLDLFAKEILLQALQAYQGTILFVSHDHDFVQKLATRIIELTPNGARSFPGSYEDFLVYKQALEKKQIDIEKKLQQKTAEKTTSGNKQQFLVRKELASIEAKIEKLEKIVETRAHELYEESYGTALYQKKLAEIEATQATLNALYVSWEELQKKLDTELQEAS